MITRCLALVTFQVLIVFVKLALLAMFEESVGEAELFAAWASTTDAKACTGLFGFGAGDRIH